MSRIEITDEMIDRAIAAGFGRYRKLAPHFADQGIREGYRKALEAALNPPAEPEIPVTEEMVRAGEQAHLECERVGNTRGTRYLYQMVYRAMFKARPYPNVPVTINNPFGQPRRKDDPK